MTALIRSTHAKDATSYRLIGEKIGENVNI
jgi:hypothetical protein